MLTVLLRILTVPYLDCVLIVSGASLKDLQVLLGKPVLAALLTHRGGRFFALVSRD